MKSLLKRKRLHKYYNGNDNHCQYILIKPVYEYRKISRFVILLDLPDDIRQGIETENAIVY